MKKVIIIGASYAGLYAAKKFSKLKNIEVKIFDKNKYHYIQVESYGYVSSIYDANKVTVDTGSYINTLNSNITFYNEEIALFDADLKEIITKDEKKYNYDYLIIATGSLTNFPIQVPNIRKYSVGIKTLSSANNVKKIFESLINETPLNKEKENFNLVIGGAGLSGVEIATEMAVVLKERKHLIQNGSQKINIIIVDGMKTVLPNMDERLISSCNKRLEDLGIEIHLGSFIKDVDETKIYLANDTIIDYDYFIFTGGIKAVTIKSTKSYDVNKLNQYLVNEYLQLKNEDDIFVIGDTAEVISNGNYVPPSAQLAIQSGEYVVDYIHSRISKNIIEPFSVKSNGVLIALGGQYAIGLLFNSIFVKGYMAHKIKNFVTYSHKAKFI